MYQTRHLRFIIRKISGWQTYIFGGWIYVVYKYLPNLGCHRIIHENPRLDSFTPFYYIEAVIAHGIFALGTLVTRLTYCL